MIQNTQPLVKSISLTALHPAPWNPRSITEERFQNLCDSIRADPDFLWHRPVLAQADGTIYAGNMRYRAAQHLGMETIPAVVEDVSDRLARERALRDNAQWGEWEEEELASLLAQLAAEDSNLDVLGFDERDLQRSSSTASSAHRRSLTPMRCRRCRMSLRPNQATSGCSATTASSAAMRRGPAMSQP